MNNFQIIWEKWIDPFGSDIDETQWNNYEDDETDNMFDDPLIKNKLEKPVKVISSPMGLIPYNEYTSSSKIFNFWVGHCNFNLSNDIVDIIEQCDGVEILDVFTRYRFRVGIGKCFNDRKTMNNIADKTYSFLETNHDQQSE